MNVKQIGSLVVLLAGIALLVCGFYGSHRMSEARQQIDTATSYVPKNPAKGFVSDALHGEVDKYKTPVALCYVGGVILTVAGAAGLYFFHGKKKR